MARMRMWRIFLLWFFVLLANNLWKCCWSAQQAPSSKPSSQNISIVSPLDGTVVQPGEILHFYATGLGQVASPPADGMPAPADPLAPTIVPVTCHAFSASGPDIPVLYAGLAPGFVGIYQLDVRLPATNLQPSMALSCTGEGNSYTSRPFAVKP